MTSCILLLHLWSVHFEPQNRRYGAYNAQTYGIGTECRLNDSRAIAGAGIYYNSFRRASAYGVAGYAFNANILQITPFVGLASGYPKYQSLHAFPFAPLMGVQFKIDRYGMQLIADRRGAVVHFTFDLLDY